MGVESGTELYRANTVQACKISELNHEEVHEAYRFGIRTVEEQGNLEETVG